MSLEPEVQQQLDNINAYIKQSPYLSKREESESKKLSTIYSYYFSQVNKPLLENPEVAKYFIPTVLAFIQSTSCDPTEKDSRGRTILHLALRYCPVDKRSIETLVKKSLSFDDKDATGMTPPMYYLHYSKSVDKDIVDLFTRQQYKWDTVDNEKRNAAHHLAMNENGVPEAVLDSLQKKDGNIFKAKDKTNRTVLHLYLQYCSEPQASIIELLLNKMNLNVSDLTKEGKNTLHCYLEGKHKFDKDIFEQITEKVEKKEDFINTADNEGNVPIFYYAKCTSDDHEDYINTFKFFLDNGCNYDVKNKSSQHILFFICMNAELQSVVEALTFFVGETQEP